MLVAVRTRLSERSPRDLRGVEALAAALGGADVEIGGGPDAGRPSGWAAVLDACRAPLRDAGKAVEAALRAGRRPVTLATDCALAIATLPAVVRAVPDVRVLWLDAHHDFLDPADGDDFLGSMALSGACGRWPTGFAPPLPPQRVALVGARSRAGADPADVAAAGVGGAALAGHDVYVHLDPDVLDPTAYAGEFPEPGGMGMDDLQAVLAEVAGAGRVVGAEVTAFHAPDDSGPLAERLADVLRVLW